MIALENVDLSVGAFAIHGVTFTIPQGSYGILMGKTGSGKSTILEAVCGLKRPDAGVVRVNDDDVTAKKPSERGIGYVPQDGALFTTMTVYENLAFALRLRNLSHDTVDTRVHELADWLGVEHLLKRVPFGLSGGERQRVALGRALAFWPKVLCLDEPLSALDHETRIAMGELLGRVKAQLGVTVLHITHDRNEAIRLADCCFEIRDGKVAAADLEAIAE